MGSLGFLTMRIFFGGSSQRSLTTFLVIGFTVKGGHKTHLPR